MIKQVVCYLLSIVVIVTAGMVCRICEAVPRLASGWHTCRRRNIGNTERRHRVPSDGGDTMTVSWYRHVSGLRPLLAGGLVPEHLREVATLAVPTT